MRQILIPLYLIVFISCNEMTQSKPTPEIINLPESKPTDFETNDSSFLKIKIKNENYETFFLNIPSTFKTINSFDSFLQKNKDRLDKNKVLVTGFDNNEKYEDFKNLLLKYGISKFRVNPKWGLISLTTEFYKAIWLFELNEKIAEKMHKHTTMGFVQVRLEIVAIISSNIAAFVRAWPTSPNIGSYYLSLLQSRAAVPGGRNSNATPDTKP